MNRSWKMHYVRKTLTIKIGVRVWENIIFSNVVDHFTRKHKNFTCSVFNFPLIFPVYAGKWRCNTDRGDLTKYQWEMDMANKAFSLFHIR